MNRTLVTIHLPIEMGAAAQVMKAVARVYPDAVIRSRKPGKTVQLVADDDPALTLADRRRIVRQRFPKPPRAKA